MDQQGEMSFEERVERAQRISEALGDGRFVVRMRNLGSNVCVAVAANGRELSVAYNEKRALELAINDVNIVARGRLHRLHKAQALLNKTSTAVADAELNLRRANEAHSAALESLEKARAGLSDTDRAVLAAMGEEA